MGRYYVTAQASAGMVLSARSLQGKLQYTAAEVNAQGELRGYSHSPMEIKIGGYNPVSNTSRGNVVKTSIQPQRRN